jgi:hypothetical protein
MLMSVSPFNPHVPCCPICSRLSPLHSPKTLAGLLNCPRCRTRLVVSWSGHYVRDPFSLKHSGVEQSLRRENHPIARIWRDLGTARSVLLLTLILSTGLIGIVGLSGKLSIKILDAPPSPPELPKSDVR